MGAKKKPSESNRGHRDSGHKSKPVSSNNKKPAAQGPAKPAPERRPDSQQAAPLPFPVQQRVLDVFDRSFTDLFQPASGADQADVDGEGPAVTENGGLVLTPLLQEMKGALFARDFAAAFEKARPELLEAYAARWSPTRALGYAGVLAGLIEHLDGLFCTKQAGPVEPAGDAADQPSGPLRRLKSVAIGGCAAEVAAFAAFLHIQNKNGQKWAESALAGDITLIDSAPWNPVVTKLHQNLITPPPLSTHASEAARAANAALIEPHLLSTTFIKEDVLTMTREQMKAHCGLSSADNAVQPILVTLFFTLNELYTSGGIGKTTAFLLNLSAVLPSGSMLLVVDSPGSYSEASVGKESKRYPMHWLLDHCLLKRERKEGESGCTWEKLATDESTWFRLSDSLRYPIHLENMRYQMHLYRATMP